MTWLTSLDGALATPFLIVAELVALLVAALVINRLLRALLGALVVGAPEGLRARVEAGRRTVRNLLWVAAAVACLAVLALNAWLLWKGVDVAEWTLARVQGIPRETWIALGLGALRTLAVAIVAWFASRLVSRGITGARARIEAWPGLRGDGINLRRFAAGLDRLHRNLAWMLVLLYGAGEVRLPIPVLTTLTILVRIYAIVGVGLLVVRANALAVDTAEAYARLYAQDKTWLPYYERLRPLLPFLRRCVEWALWVLTATLVLREVPPTVPLSRFGPPLIEAIGIVFLARAALELGRLWLDRVLLPAEGLTEAERRRRQTVAPLAGQLLGWVVGFIALVLMLGALGFNPMPFLAGAGILGLVLGFGAQPLLNDVVSGFFILFENLLMVGDVVEIGETRGRVEGIDFRTTRVRDFDGRLHVLRNGDLRHVINYSREWVNAVVVVDVAYGSDLQRVQAAIRSCDPLLRTDPEVLGDIDFVGITAFADSGMTVRMTVQVAPARHAAVASRLRALIADAFAREGIEIPFPQRVVTLRQEGTPSAPTPQILAG